jgi:hypothetical protein
MEKTVDIPLPGAGMFATFDVVNPKEGPSRIDFVSE